MVLTFGFGRGVGRWSVFVASACSSWSFSAPCSLTVFVRGVLCGGGWSVGAGGSFPGGCCLVRGIAQWGTARLCLTNAQGAVRGSPGGAESVLGCGCDGAGPVMMHGDDLAGHLLGPVASAPFSVLFFSG